MIFVTVGTEKFAFNRLLKIIDDGVRDGEIQENVFAQTGNSDYIPEQFEHCRFMPFNEMLKCFQEATIVVCHAGVGTTILSLNSGKVPIVFPRLFKLGEHLDDHQVEFSVKMESLGKIIVAYDSLSLFEKIKNYRGLVSALSGCDLSSNKNDLIEFLGNTLESSNGNS